MIKTLAILAFAGASGAAGYVGGSIYPAPPAVTDAVNKGASDLRARLKLEEVDFTGFRALVSETKFAQIKTELNDLAVASGEVIEVEQDVGTVEEQLNNLALPAPAPAAPAPTPSAPAAATPPGPVLSAFEKSVSLCPRMTVQNSPQIAKYSPQVVVKGVKIAAFPSRGACLSSGFGQRSGRLHKGVDYHSETGAPILSGGDGSIIEMKYREDYGNMIVIDHGGGVYTRYAHLASFGKGLTPGVTVTAGEQIGLMGNTAGYQIPMHLHYEVLVGDITNGKGSFGLEPVDPFSFPSAT